MNDENVLLSPNLESSLSILIGVPAVPEALDKYGQFRLCESKMAML